MTGREDWRAVPGYEGYYEVSDQGRVRSLDRVVTVGGRTPYERILKGRLLCPTVNGQGYLWIALSKGGHTRGFGVHQLVMAAFVGPRPPDLVTRHRNGVGADARLSNLSYSTQSENLRDRAIHGTDPHANRAHCSNGHAYTDANCRRDANGHRRCRACVRNNSRRYKQRKKAALLGAAA